MQSKTRQQQHEESLARLQALSERYRKAASAMYADQVAQQNYSNLRMQDAAYQAKRRKKHENRVRNAWKIGGLAVGAGAGAAAIAGGAPPQVLGATMQGGMGLGDAGASLQLGEEVDTASLVAAGQGAASMTSGIKSAWDTEKSKNAAEAPMGTDPRTGRRDAYIAPQSGISGSGGTYQQNTIPLGVKQAHETWEEYYARIYGAP